MEKVPWPLFFSFRDAYNEQVYYGLRFGEAFVAKFDIKGALKERVFYETDRYTAERLIVHNLIDWTS